jgi:transcription termination factor Rho
MDEVIFEEFKGTGNSELRLDRKLSERRIWPSIDITASSTRREELLLEPETLKRVWLMRRMTSQIASNSPNQTEATERLLEFISRFETNAEFLTNLKTEM